MSQSSNEHPKISSGARLTQREREVLRLVAMGRSTREIASITGEPYKTIEHMLGSSDERGIYAKIGVSNRAQAAAWYIENYGLLGAKDCKKENSSDESEDLSSSMVSSLLAKGYVDVVYSGLETLHQIWIDGRPEFALTKMPSLDRKLRGMIKDIDVTLSVETAPSILNPLRKALARVLYIEVQALKQRKTPTNTPRYISGEISRYITQIRRLATDCRDPEIDGWADFCLGDAFYVQEDYVAAIPLLRKALGKVRSPEDKLAVIRVLALSWAYIRDAEQFKETSNIATRIIEEVKSGSNTFVQRDTVSLVLEGIGRGQGLLNQPEKALVTLADARMHISELFSGNKHVTIRDIQVDRSEVEIGARTPSIDKAQLETRGRAAMIRAQEHGYARHATQIERLLATYLN